ncbi:MAG: hypothetical protein QOJ00_2271, partial [Actinomycetota bacterium]
RSVHSLQTEVVKDALDDAGLSLSDVDGFATVGVGGFPATEMCEYLGIRPTWTDSSSAGGSSFEIYVHHAAAAIRAGLCGTVVIAYGSNQKSARSRRVGGGGMAAGPMMTGPNAQFEMPYGFMMPMSPYALAAKRHMHEFGTTPEQLAEVAVSARAWALKNPKAYRYEAGPLTIDDVLASDMQSDPLHKLDCCLVTDGGGAVVLTADDRARDLKKPPVGVLGTGEAHSHSNVSQMPDLTKTGSWDSSARAYAQAGLTPSDVDVALIYDSFTITTLLTLEGLGFCGRGEAGAFVEDGKTRPGGAFPLNTSGGGLSYCHPGMYGVFLLVEAVRQLRGECGERQVANAEVAIAHGTGGILSSHSTVLLGRS